MSLRYLADTSAWNRLHHSAVKESMAPRVTGGEVGTCSIVDMEVLYSARNADDYQRMRSLRRLSCELLPVDQRVCDRAQEVQEMLSAESKHRAALTPDLLIAACAEAHDVVVLHYDSDFDHIAKVTGQPVEWVVPRGSVS